MLLYSFVLFGVQIESELTAAELACLFVQITSCRILIVLVCRHFWFARILGKILFFSFGLLFLALFFVLFAFSALVLLLAVFAAVLFFLAEELC